MEGQMFLDLDGVLCDLLGGIEIMMNITLDHTKGSIDLMGSLGISKEEFWDNMSIENWANLPKTNDADEILSLVEKYKPVILSANTTYGAANCIVGKLKWMEKNIPDYYEENRYFFGKEKFKLAYPGAILIDDYEYNTDKWDKAGGTAILVPRPWNRMSEHSEHAVNYIDFCLGVFMLRGGINEYDRYNVL